MKRIFTCMLLCAATWFVSCEKEAAEIAVTGISLPDQTTLSLIVGEEKTLQASITPSDATNTAVSWESSASAVVTVSETGVLKAIAPGSAVITVKTLAGGYSATCTVTVVRPQATGITLSEEILALSKGERQTLTVTLEPVSSTGTRISWSSSNEAVATVDENGQVTAGQRGGTAVITAGADGQTATCTVQVTPDVYLGGHVYKSGFYTPTIWTNGQAIALPGAEKNNSVNSVQVVEGDVYAAGGIREGNAYVAVYWKNGEMIRLSDGTTNAQAQSVFIFDGEVYVVGYITNASGKYFPALWKNGQSSTLPHEMTQGRANSVFVSDGDVYVAGAAVDQTGFMRPALWKNGQPTVLPGGINDGEAFSVFVSGDDVYVTGHVDGDYVNGRGYPVPTFWKNGEPSRLPGGERGGQGSSVCVSGDDVYVAGHVYLNNNGRTAALWKNGEITYLCQASSNAQANSVAVFGNDVYVAGFASEGAGAYATLWKNGEAVTYEIGGANSVFVY